jgi:hypothetical protein
VAPQLRTGKYSQYKNYHITNADKKAEFLGLSPVKYTGSYSLPRSVRKLHLDSHLILTDGSVDKVQHNGLQEADLVLSRTFLWGWMKKELTRTKPNFG